MAKQEYLDFIRGKVGHELIFLPCACAIVTDEKGRVLIQRVPGGKWGLPGGLCELGESADETAVREVFEETGLRVETDELWGIYTKYHAVCDNGDELQPFCVLFTAHITGGELTCDGDETLELRFAAREEVPKNFRYQQADMINDYFDGNKGVYR